MPRGRPVERETRLDPSIMIDLEQNYPKRSAFAALAGVSPQALHRMLNQEPCHQWEVDKVERTWRTYRGPVVRELLDKPPKELTPAENFNLRRLVADLYPLALGTALSGVPVASAFDPEHDPTPPPPHDPSPPPLHDPTPPPRHDPTPPARRR